MFFHAFDASFDLECGWHFFEIADHGSGVDGWFLFLIFGLRIFHHFECIIFHGELVIECEEADDADDIQECSVEEAAPFDGDAFIIAA